LREKEAFGWFRWPMRRLIGERQPTLISHHMTRERDSRVDNPCRQSFIAEQNFLGKTAETESNF